MNEKTLSGLRWFLLFAWPCVWARLLKRLISQEQYKALARLIESGDDPDVALLIDCFPNAVADLRRYAVEHGRLHDLWSANTVLGYWRAHKNSGQEGMSSDCAVKKCTVSECSSDRLYVQVRFGNVRFVTRNLYKLPLYPDDIVQVHQRCIIMKETSGPV